MHQQLQRPYPLETCHTLVVDYSRVTTAVKFGRRGVPMVRRVSSSQLRSQIQRAQQKRRQSINDYNAAIRKTNQAINKYNSAARLHNARVRANQARLQRAVSRFQSSTRSTQRVTFRSSVVTVQETFRRVEGLAATDRWIGDDQLFDLMEGEAANSAETWNALEGDTAQDTTAEDDLGQTRITSELSTIDPDFDARWRGALYALNPANPDAARHFCTSSRELVDRILLRAAPDAVVKAELENYEPTPNGGVSRRARIRFCLVRSGRYAPEIHDFADANLENVIQLFSEFNEGTHGSAGHFSVGQLRVIKRRVEDAILFLHAIVR
jgi:hypothetical protein